MRAWGICYRNKIASKQHAHLQPEKEKKMTLNRADLQRFIDTHGIEAAILPMKGHTSTVDDAARELGVDSDQVIKSLIFKVDGQPLLVINNGTARVDRKKLAAVLGVGRKRVKFADAETALELTGYMIGSMPPFGHRQGLRTIVDRAVTRMDQIFGGGGDIDAMMRLTPGELLRVTAAEVVDVSE